MIDTDNIDASTVDLRRLVELFPRDLAMHRKFILRVADEIDRLRNVANVLHADMASAAERIAAQSDLLSRQRNAARRCAEIAREEAKVYDDRARKLEEVGRKPMSIPNHAASIACNRIADRIEGEVVT